MRPLNAPTRPLHSPSQYTNTPSHCTLSILQYTHSRPSQYMNIHSQCIVAIYPLIANTTAPNIFSLPSVLTSFSPLLNPPSHTSSPTHSHLFSLTFSCILSPPFPSILSPLLTHPLIYPFALFLISPGEDAEVLVVYEKTNHLPFMSFEEFVKLPGLVSRYPEINALQVQLRLFNGTVQFYRTRDLVQGIRGGMYSNPLMPSSFTPSQFIHSMQLLKCPLSTSSHVIHTSINLL